MAPAPGVAVAETVTALPAVTTEPVTGTVTATLGAVAAPAVTETAVEVVVLPLLSVTFAVSEKFAAEAGTQLVV